MARAVHRGRPRAPLVTHRHPLHVSVLLAVALGGATGATLRHLLTVLSPDDTGFPWTTFGINVSGAFLLALLPASSWVRHHPVLPPLLGTGLLGGFTTMSAWSEQSRALVDDGAVATAALYVVGTLAACLAAVALADRFSAPAERAEFDEEEGDL